MATENTKAAEVVLVTGGAGYIGSHTCLVLLEAGYDVVVMDNFVNSSPVSLQRVQELTKRTLRVFPVDLCDAAATDKVFAETRPKAVIHFAGLKAVGESVSQPLRYYENNICSTLNLLKSMERHGCRVVVFSSSATVYGDPASVPILETFPLTATSPYGRTKLFIEYILQDVLVAHPDFEVNILRYFNPIGAHPSGRIGEDPKGIPGNLVPFVAQVAVGKRAQLSVFGHDYATPDGTGVRDYIHVMDLAHGHVAALKHSKPGSNVFNLGAGKGFSVLEVVAAFEKASGIEIKRQLVDRRPGDVACCYADASKAKAELEWEATLGLDAMCADAWRWQSANPDGYV